MATLLLNPNFDKGIVLREKKGSELTFEEMDNNFKKLILMNVLLRLHVQTQYVVGAFEYYPTFEQVAEYASVGDDGKKIINTDCLGKYYTNNNIFTDRETYFVRINRDDDLNGIYLSDEDFLGFVTTAGFEESGEYSEDDTGSDYSTIGDKFLAVFRKRMIE